MPYYHVLIDTNEFAKPYYELDKIDLSEIKEEIIGPYLRGEQFFFNGAFLDNVKNQSSHQSSMLVYTGFWERPLSLMI